MWRREHKDMLKRERRNGLMIRLMKKQKKKKHKQKAQETQENDGCHERGNGRMKKAVVRHRRRKTGMPKAPECAYGLGARAQPQEHQPKKDNAR